MKKVAGTIILSIGFLTTALIIMLAQISFYLDQVDNEFENGIITHIPVIIYFLLLVPICIGTVLLLKKEQ